MHITRQRGRALATTALMAVLCGPPLRAAEPGEPRGAATRPSATDVPTSDDQVVKALVSELGSENPKTRTQAAAILRKMGKEALPALRAGAKDSDAQVRASSQNLIDRIQDPQKYEPKPPPAQAYSLGRADRIRIMHAAPLRLEAGVNVMTVERNGRRDVMISEPGRNVRIHEDAAGIRLLVIDGLKVDQFQAADADELKRTAPEAFKIYDQYGR